MPAPTLFAVQTEALARSNYRPGFAYFMEQGLGKTGTALWEFQTLKNEDKVDQLLVICPNSLKENWREETKLWLETEAKIWPQYDLRKSKDTPLIYIMNYEALLASGLEVAQNFLQLGRTMMVLDESSRIKSHAAQTTKKTLLLGKYAVYRRVLTGTPMTQNVMDLWPQLRFIGELDGVNPYAFRNHFAVLGGYMGKQVTGFKNETELHAILENCGFRAKKRDWLKDLPEKLPPVIRDITMSPDQKLVFDEMKNNFYTLVQKQEISASQVITQMEKLAQIGRGFLYDERGKAMELVKPEMNPAVIELHRILAETEGKAIIITVHEYCTTMLRKVLPEAAFIVKEDDLRIAGTNIEDQKAKFNRDPRCRQIICQISVGKFGHTLLGGPADDRCATTIFFENTYSLEARQQAEDRNHRIGQDKGVSYFDIAASVIDRKVIKALQRKENMAKAIIDAVKEDHA